MRPSFQVTRAADYAVRALIHLALGGDRSVSQGALARAIEVPLPFLAKVLQRLASEGLVASVRGKRGGYHITERGCAASMLDVIEAINGPVLLNVCLGDAPACPRAAWCPAHVVWRNLASRFHEILSAATVAHLALAERERRAGSGPTAARSDR